MEPRRLLEEGGTEIEKELLLAGRDDAPRAEAACEVLAALQGPSALPPPGGAEAAVAAGTTAKAITAGTWAKLALLAAGLGGAGTVVHHYARPGTPAAPVPTIASQAGPAAPEPIPARPESLGLPSLPPASASREGRGRPSRPTREVREPTNPPSTIDHSLGLETRALDRAKESLDGHRFAEALRLLGEYESAFPQGRLRPEARVLRLAALVHGGKHSAARSLAQRLLADDAYRTYESRIRSLLREMDK